MLLHVVAEKETVPQINWKMKSFIYRVLDVSKLTGPLYWIQKYVTRKSQVSFQSVNQNWITHADTLEGLEATENVLEFGAGKSLAQNLFLSRSVERQTVVDLNRMIDFELVNRARTRLNDLGYSLDPSDILNISDLKKFNITYLAPFDLRFTSFSDNCFDACISTNTLEHIPREDIIAIFTELRRIMSTGGVISAVIDYTDHYAYTDKTIGMLNYLQFSESEWTKYNHNCHYQNRMRHYEYLEIFRNIGFTIVSENLTYSEDNIPMTVREKYQEADKTWVATGAHIVLRNH